MSNLRVENERDQSLRPWTLDITSDESIAVECGKLDTTVKRSSPFKQGGDYAYLTKLKSSTSDAFETTELTITSPKPKQNYSRFHQGQFDVDILDEAVRRYPNSIMMSSQNDTTTSLLSNSERFHPSLRKSKSLPFMIPSTIRITPPQSNRTERGKSATLNSDHKSRLLFSRGPEGNIASLRDDGAIDTATHGLSINHNSAMSLSNSRISCARLVEGNPKNSSFSGTLNLSAKDYDGTIISHDIDHPIGRVITSRVNERTAKHSGRADENIRRRNSSGSSVSGILIPISVTDILSQSSDSKTGDGSALTRRHAKNVRSIDEQSKTSSGFHSLHVHLDASPEKRAEVVNFAAISRSMVSGVKSNSQIDSLWNLLTTPGYHDSIGTENIYKSQMNLAHSSNKDFEKSILNMDRTLNIKIDALSKWTEKAGENNIQIFTPGGTMKFN